MGFVLFSFQRDIIFWYFDSKLFAVFGIIFFGEAGSILNRHRRNVFAVNEDSGGHFSGGISKVVVIYGQRGGAADTAGAFFTGNDRDAFGLAYICNQAGTGSNGIVRRNIDDVTFSGGIFCGIRKVIGIGEQIGFAGITYVGQFLL